MNSRERIHKWDNLKTILMFLVVIGHFANQYDEHILMRSISLFIYAFHMPLFIFVSGLFCKKWKEGASFSWDKPVYYILIGYALKIAIYLIKISFGKTPKFKLFEDTGIPWFMFAMAGFIILTYLLRKIKWYYCLPVSILIACLAGYSNAVGSFLYLSRILVFFPFYYMGYLLDSETVLKAANHSWIKWSSAILLAVTGLISTIYISDLYSYIRLFTARNAYNTIHVDNCGAGHRLAWYGIAFLMGLAVIVLTPNKENKLADKIGKRTLQIYFWHRLILYVLVYSGFADRLSTYFPYSWKVVYLLIAVAVTIVLMNDVFSIPLKVIQKWERKVI